MSERIPGGKAPGGRCPRGVDPAELRAGMRVEMEHTSDRRVAREIACDHLTEDRRYYTKLRRVHLDGAAMSICKRVVTPTSKLDKRSFRYTAWRGAKGRRSRVIIGCPKGHWKPRAQRCAVGTKAHVVERETSGRCKHGYTRKS